MGLLTRLADGDLQFALVVVEKGRSVVDREVQRAGVLVDLHDRDAAHRKDVLFIRGDVTTAELSDQRAQRRLLGKQELAPIGPMAQPVWTARREARDRLPSAGCLNAQNGRDTSLGAN